MTFQIETLALKHLILSYFSIASVLSPQAFAPNQVKPYICTTEACLVLFVKPEIQQRASSGNKKEIRQRIA